MKQTLLALLLFGAFPAGAGTVLEMDTTAGLIRVELYDDRAPVTVENFLRYVRGGAFEDGSFYRVVRADNQPNNEIRIAVIQGGPREGFEEVEPVPLERTSVTGVKHEAGTISMARDAPDTATGHFFICVEDEPELDFGGRRNPDGQGFAAFGKVIEGMEAVRAIQQGAVTEQTLQNPVRIRSVTIVAGGERREKPAQVQR